tara:strand:+ start:316 stop:543 length:228 start_codon:yes stop_codon:yes gene_type:complete
MKIDVVKREGDGKFAAWVQMPISHFDNWTQKQVDLANRKIWFVDHLKWVLIAVANTKKDALAKARDVMGIETTAG